MVLTMHERKDVEEDRSAEDMVRSVQERGR